MDDFSVLLELGLKEVSNKTHIEVKNLEYMINSQFDKLNRTSTLGFVKIISREYKLDLTDWLSEAEKFWSENKTDGSGVKIFVVQKQKNIAKRLFMVLSIVVLAAILYGAYIFLNHKLDFFENPLVKKDINYTYEDTPVVSEAKENLEKNITQDENDTVETQDENKTLVVESNATETSKIYDKNISVAQPNQELNTTINDQNSTKKQILEEQALKQTETYISPNTKLWVGVIYLDNFKRASFLGKDNFSIDTSRDQLITTGHGNFKLYFHGKIEKFKPQNPVRLLVKDGNISQINDKEFKDLNKGSLW